MAAANTTRTVHPPKAAVGAPPSVVPRVVPHVSPRVVPRVMPRVMPRVVSPVHEQQQVPVEVDLASSAAREPCRPSEAPHRYYDGGHDFMYEDDKKYCRKRNFNFFFLGCFAGLIFIQAFKVFYTDFWVGNSPSFRPTSAPTSSPSSAPTASPSGAPTGDKKKKKDKSHSTPPTGSPSESPTRSPTTRAPTSPPTQHQEPTGSPSTGNKQEPSVEDPGCNFVKYWILGISKKATAKEIKQAYRRRALKAHPDKGGDAATFRELHDAYELLIDPESRKRYDNSGESGLRENLRSEAKGYKEWRQYEEWRRYEEWHQSNRSGGSSNRSGSGRSRSSGSGRSRSSGSGRSRSSS